jgi:hypothetical protein
VIFKVNRKEERPPLRNDGLFKYNDGLFRSLFNFSLFDLSRFSPRAFKVQLLDKSSRSTQQDHNRVYPLSSHFDPQRPRPSRPSFFHIFLYPISISSFSSSYYLERATFTYRYDSTVCIRSTWFASFRFSLAFVIVRLSQKKSSPSFTAYSSRFTSSYTFCPSDPAFPTELTAECDELC